MEPTEERSEWATGWPVVVAGLAGMGCVAVATSSIGLFLPELEQTFGWSRAEVVSGTAINAAVSMMVYPFIGSLIDRGYARTMALVSLASGMAAFAAFGLSSGSLAQWWVQWVLFSLFIAGINPTIWTAAVSRRFHKARGLALSVVLTGSSISGFTAPLVARVLIDEIGWRGAYAGLGAIYGFVPLLLVWIFFDRKAPDAPNVAQDTPAKAASIAGPGLGFKEAFFNLRVVMIMAATVIGFTVLVGTMVHTAPLLSSKGMTPVIAATGAAIVSGSAFPGKLVFGWIVDRVPGNIVGAIAFALPAAALLLLRACGSDPTIALIAIAIAGLGFGGMVPLTAYLTGRYAGMRNFGKIFGVITSLMGAGAGIGPLSAGLMFDMTKS